MARTKVEIKFLGTPDFVMDFSLGPRRNIRHIFRRGGERYDVTDLATSDELNRSSYLANLIDAGKLDVVVTAGAYDIDGAGFGDGPAPSDADPEDTVAGGGAD